MFTNSTPSFGAPRLGMSPRQELVEFYVELTEDGWNLGSSRFGIAGGMAVGGQR